MVRHAKVAPSHSRTPARSRAASSVEARQRSSRSAAAGATRESTGRTNPSTSQNLWPLEPAPVSPFAPRRGVAGLRRGTVHLEQVVAQRLLELGVAVDLDVGPVPERVERLPLVGEQPLPAPVAAGPDGRDST